MPFEKLNAFTKKVSDLSDVPNSTMTTEQVKAQFDAAPEEVRVYLNKLIDVLQSTETGDSGADNIKMTPIDTSPDTVRGVLLWLKNQMDVAQLGQLTDGSITDIKLSNDPTQIKQRANDFIASKGQANGLTPTDVNNKVPLAYIPISDLKVAVPGTTNDLYLFDNITTGNNVSTNGAGNWFTLMEQSFMKQKGWVRLGLIISNFKYTNSLTTKTGTEYASKIRISINSTVIDESDAVLGLGTNISIDTVESGIPFTLKIELMQPIGTTQTYAFGSADVSRNEVYDIVL